jgi:hypothetical protein
VERHVAAASSDSCGLVAIGSSVVIGKSVLGGRMRYDYVLWQRLYGMATCFIIDSS